MEKMGDAISHGRNRRGISTQRQATVNEQIGGARMLQATYAGTALVGRAAGRQADEEQQRATADPEHRHAEEEQQRRAEAQNRRRAEEQQRHAEKAQERRTKAQMRRRAEAEKRAGATESAASMRRSSSDVRRRRIDR